MTAHQAAVEAGLTWLRRRQLPSGELPSFASFLNDGPPAWKPTS
ncbi:hypothetical protein ACE2AJ_08075 [Aquihabitans daechungensis]